MKAFNIAGAALAAILLALAASPSRASSALIEARPAFDLQAHRLAQTGVLTEMWTYLQTATGFAIRGKAVVSVANRIGSVSERAGAVGFAYLILRSLHRTF